MKNLKLFFLATLGYTITGICFSYTTEKEQYIETYSMYVLSKAPLIAQAMISEGIPKHEAGKRAEAFVSKSIDCHIKYLDDYPEVIRNALYGTIVIGGSYPDANNAVETLIAEAHFEGNNSLIE